MRKKYQIKLKSEELQWLEKAVVKRGGPLARKERARFMLESYSGESIYSIAKRHKTNRNKVQRLMRKAALYGARTALDDLPGKGRRRSISDGARTWLLDIADKNPRDLGLPECIWTLGSLAEYARLNAEKEGWVCFGKIGKGTVSKIFSKVGIHTSNMRYFHENRRGVAERSKVHVMCFCVEVELVKAVDGKKLMVGTLSVARGVFGSGERGVQEMEKRKKRGEGMEKAPYGDKATMSFLLCVNICNGKIYGVHNVRKCDRGFVDLLELLNSDFAEEVQVEIILEKHLPALSCDANEYLKDRRGRFGFTFTYGNAELLNMVETFVGKIIKNYMADYRAGSTGRMKMEFLDFLDRLNGFS